MRRLNKLIAALVVGVMVISTATPALAAENTTPAATQQTVPAAPIPDDGTVFNYYNKTFDVQQYTKYNPDLVTVFGSQSIMYPMHYVLCGIKEGRRLGDAWDSKAFVRNHSDYIWQATLAGSKDWFDAEKYRTLYPDILAAFGNDDVACLVHYLYYGAYEGRFSCGKYDPALFAYRYPTAEIRTNCSTDDFVKAWGVHLTQGTAPTVSGNSGDDNNSSGGGGGGSKKPAKPITVDAYSLRKTDGDNIVDIDIRLVNPIKVANNEGTKKFKDIYEEYFGDSNVSMVAWCDGQVVATQTVTSKKFKVNEKEHTATLNLNKTYWKKTFQSEVALPEYFQMTWVPGESGTELPNPTPSDDELGDDWTSMKFKVGTTVYQLPISVRSFKEAGWSFTINSGSGDVDGLTIPAKTSYTYDVINPELQTSNEGMSVAVVNVSDSVMSVDDCDIYGIMVGTIPGESLNVSLPKGVKTATADLTTLLQAYGDYTEQDDSTYVWKSGDKRLGLFQLPLVGNLFAYMIDPLPSGSDEIDLGQDWTSLRMTIDGELVSFPVSFADLSAIGWFIDDEEKDLTVEPGEEKTVTLLKDCDDFIFITARVINQGTTTTKATNCTISHLLAGNESYAPTVAFPKGICNKTSTIDDVIAAYGDPYTDEDNSTSRQLTYRSGSKEFVANFYKSGSISWFYGYTGEISDDIEISACELLKVNPDGDETSVSHVITINDNSVTTWEGALTSYLGDDRLVAHIRFNDGSSVDVNVSASNFDVDEEEKVATLDMSTFNFSGANVVVKDGVETVWTFRYTTSGQQDIETLGDDWKSMKFGFTDGTIIQLPVPMQRLLDNGWEFKYPTTQGVKVIDPWDDVSSIDLSKDNNTMTVSVWNTEDTQQGIADCIVYKVYFPSSNNTAVLPGNIHVNASTMTRVHAAYGEPDNTRMYSDTWYDGEMATPGTGSALWNYIEIQYKGTDDERVSWVSLCARVENSGMGGSSSSSDLEDVTLDSSLDSGQFCIKSGDHITLGDTVSSLKGKGYTVTAGDLLPSPLSDEPSGVDLTTYRLGTVTAPDSTKGIEVRVCVHNDDFDNGTIVGVNAQHNSSDILLPGGVLASKATLQDMIAAWGAPTDINHESTAIPNGTDLQWDTGMYVLDVYMDSQGKIYSMDYSVATR